MSSVQIAPWQVGRVTPLARVAAAGLVAVALDSLFLWRTAPGSSFWTGVALILPVVALRLIRGVRFAPVAAAAALGSTALVTLLQLASNAHHTGYAKAALVVAAAVSIVGCGASVGALLKSRGWLGSLPNTSVVIGFLHETHDFLRKTTNRD